MVSELLVDLGARLLVAIVFCLINALILREIVVLIFKLEDTTVATALHLSIWLGFALILLSFLPQTTLFNILSVILMYILFVFLVMFYYKTDWKKSILIWLVWFIAYIIVSVLIILIFMLFS